MMRIGFIGLGGMGLPMAGNLIKAGHDLIVWNRSAEKTNELVRLGARAAERPMDVADTKGIVITMVANDAALDDVVFGPDGFGNHLTKGGLHLSMGTISLELSKKLQQFHEERGAAFVAAPVFGRPADAQAGSLFVVCAGVRTERERVAPLLKILGQKLFDVGDEPVHANVVKLSGNFMFMAAIEAMAEAFTLGERYGVARQKTYDVLTQSIFPGSTFVDFGLQIARHSYTPVPFKLSLGLKDANLVLAAANDVSFPMPVASLMQQRYLSAMSKGRHNLDWTAVAMNVSEDAGLAIDG